MGCSRYGLEIEQGALVDGLVGEAEIKIKRCGKCGLEKEENYFIEGEEGKNESK